MIYLLRALFAYAVSKTAHAKPPLTTVSDPIRRMGCDTAQLLIDTVEAYGRAVSNRCRIECRLVIRGSTEPRK